MLHINRIFIGEPILVALGADGVGAVAHVVVRIGDVVSVLDLVAAAEDVGDFKVSLFSNIVFLLRDAKLTTVNRAYF